MSDKQKFLKWCKEQTTITPIDAENVWSYLRKQNLIKKLISEFRVGFIEIMNQYTIKGTSCEVCHIDELNDLADKIKQQILGEDK